MLSPKIQSLIKKFLNLFIFPNLPDLTQRQNHETTLEHTRRVLYERSDCLVADFGRDESSLNVAGQ